jgi:hypothetical protein
MAYDAALADRLREVLSDEDGVTEQRMFGGLAFMVNGNMAVAASGHGGLMVRVAPADGDAALARPHTEPMVMRGRGMPGWIRVAVDGVRTKRELRAWVNRGVSHARALPAKRR